MSVFVQSHPYRPDICVLFIGGPEDRLPCGDGRFSTEDNVTLMNWNGDAGANLSDGIGVLNYLFLGGAPHALGVGSCVSLPSCLDACTER